MAFAGHSILYRISPNAASIPKCGSLAQTAQEVPSSWAVVLSASRSDAIELILALPITVAVQADEQNSKKLISALTKPKNLSICIKQRSACPSKSFIALQLRRQIASRD